MSFFFLFDHHREWISPFCYYEMGIRYSQANYTRYDANLLHCILGAKFTWDDASTPSLYSSSPVHGFKSPAKAFSGKITVTAFSGL
jgi:hypothetical protein